MRSFEATANGTLQAVGSDFVCLKTCFQSCHGSKVPRFVCLDQGTLIEAPPYTVGWYGGLDGVQEAWPIRTHSLERMWFFGASWISTRRDDTGLLSMLAARVHRNCFACEQLNKFFPHVSWTIFSLPQAQCLIDCESLFIVRWKKTVRSDDF